MKRKILKLTCLFALLLSINISFSSTTSEVLGKNDNVEITKEELYDQIIQIKNSQIIQLNNIISWIIGIAAILLSIVTLILGWELNRIKKMNNDLNEKGEAVEILISKLNSSFSDIQIAQKSINEILTSTEFHEKLDNFDKEMETINLEISEWKAFHLNDKIEKLRKEKKQIASTIGGYLCAINSSSIIKKLNPKELNIFRDIEQCTKNIENCTVDNLNTMQSDINTIFYKYYDETEEYSYV